MQSLKSQFQICVLSFILFSNSYKNIIVQVSESGVHRPHVAGIHGRESEGAYSIVLSGGYEDDLVHELFFHNILNIFSYIILGPDLPTAPEYPEHLLKSMFVPRTPHIRKFTLLKPYFPSNSRRSANFNAISFSPFAFERKRII